MIDDKYDDKLRVLIRLFEENDYSQHGLEMTYITCFGENAQANGFCDVFLDKAIELAKHGLSEHEFRCKFTEYMFSKYDIDRNGRFFFDDQIDAVEELFNKNNYSQDFLKAVLNTCYSDNNPGASLDKAIELAKQGLSERDFNYQFTRYIRAKEGRMWNQSGAIKIINNNNRRVTIYPDDWTRTEIYDENDNARLVPIKVLRYKLIDENNDHGRREEVDTEDDSTPDELYSTKTYYERRDRFFKMIFERSKSDDKLSTLVNLFQKNRYLEEELSSVFVVCYSEETKKLGLTENYLDKAIELAKQDLSENDFAYEFTKYMFLTEGMEWRD